MPRTNLHPEAIKDFEVENDKYVKDRSFMCGICDLPCKSEGGVKIHLVKTHKNDKTINKEQSFQNSATDKAGRNKKLVKQKKQSNCPVRENQWKMCSDSSTCGHFSMQTGSRCMTCIKTRITLDMKRCGQLKHIFDSPEIGPRLKSRLHRLSLLPANLQL